MKKWKQYINVELIMTAFILIVVLILATDGFLVKKLASSAMAFPGFVFIAAVAVGMLELVQNMKSTASRIRDMPTDEKAEPIITNKKNFMAICIMLTVYFVLLYLVGFVISSIVFSFMFAIYHKYKRMVLFSILTVIIVLFWHFLFTKFLGVHFPAGVLTGLFGRR